jgi:hypothetical protein
MDFERLEQVWRSQANRPSEALQARLMEELMSTLKTRRRTEALLAGIPLAAMTLLTVAASAVVLRGGDTARSWLGLVMLGLCWIVMITAFWISFRARPRDDGQPLSETLSRLLARNRKARRNYHVFWLMAPVYLTPMWLEIGRLQADGRLEGGAGLEVYALCGLSLTAAIGWNTLRYFMALKPEQRRLESLLAEYQA